MCKICKRHNPETPPLTKQMMEKAIDRNDQTIRELIDDLVDGTRQLKTLYTGEKPSDDKSK